MATRYELGGSGVGARFSAPVQTDPGSHPASYTKGTGLFPGVKRPGRGVNHSLHLETRLNKEKSYIYNRPLCLHDTLFVIVIVILFILLIKIH